MALSAERYYSTAVGTLETAHILGKQQIREDRTESRTQYRLTRTGHAVKSVIGAILAAVPAPAGGENDTRRGGRRINRSDQKVEREQLALRSDTSWARLSRYSRELTKCPRLPKADATM